jgi:hypothetical protein
MVVTEHAGARAGTAPQEPVSAVQQAHLTVRATRCRRRRGRVVSSHPRRAHAVHRRRVSARRGTATPSAPPAVTAPRPRTRSVIICLAVTMGIGLAYLALAEVVHWDTHLKLFWSGLLLIVLTGAIFENAITLDARSTGQHDPRSGLKPAGKSAPPLPQETPGYHDEAAGGGVVRVPDRLFPGITHRG